MGTAIVSAIDLRVFFVDRVLSLQTVHMGKIVPMAFACTQCKVVRVIAPAMETARMLTAFLAIISPNVELIIVIVPRYVLVTKDSLARRAL